MFRSTRRCLMWLRMPLYEKLKFASRLFFNVFTLIKDWQASSRVKPDPTGTKYALLSFDLFCHISSSLIRCFERTSSSKFGWALECQFLQERKIRANAFMEKKILHLCVFARPQFCSACDELGWYADGLVGWEKKRRRRKLESNIVLLYWCSSYYDFLFLFVSYYQTKMPDNFIFLDISFISNKYSTKHDHFLSSIDVWALMSLGAKSRWNYKDLAAGCQRISIFFL